MTPEIRRAALRMAAKAAMLGAIGCSAPAPPGAAMPTPPGNTAPAPTAGASCEAYLGSLATYDLDVKAQLADDDPLKKRSDVYGAFARIADRSAPRTHACCTTQLVAAGSQAKQRWACCSALDAVPAGADPSACSPWGPPCPPAMG